MGFPTSACSQESQSLSLFFFSLAYVFIQSNHRLFLLTVGDNLLPLQTSLNQASQPSHWRGLVSGSSFTWIENLPAVQ